MSTPPAEAPPSPLSTSADELDLERHLVVMERLVSFLRELQRRRTAIYGPQDPLVLEAALRLPQFDRTIDEARRDQARRRDRLL